MKGRGLKQGIERGNKVHVILEERGKEFIFQFSIKNSSLNIIKNKNIQYLYRYIIYYEVNKIKLDF